jgi:hypothetical protein
MLCAEQQYVSEVTANVNADADIGFHCSTRPIAPIIGLGRDYAIAQKAPRQTFTLCAYAMPPLFKLCDEQDVAKKSRNLTLPGCVTFARQSRSKV